MFEVLITKTASSEAVEGSVLLHQASVQALRAGLLLQTHHFVPRAKCQVFGTTYEESSMVRSGEPASRRMRPS